MKRCVGETHSITSSFASPPGGQNRERPRGDSRLKLFTNYEKNVLHYTHTFLDMNKEFFSVLMWENTDTWNLSAVA